MLSKVKSFFTTKEPNRLAFTYTGIIRFMPLIVAGGFFLCTILLVLAGPLDWHISNPLKFYTFVFACFVALVLGYLLAVFKAKSIEGSYNKLNVSRILYICVAVALILYFPTVKVSTGKWYPDVYTGITRTGLAYQIAKYYSQYAPKLLFYVRMLLAPFTMIIMPVTFFYKSRITKPAFALGITVVVLNVALSISQGVTKTVADTVMQIVLFLLILMFKGKLKNKKEAALHFVKFIAIILVVCVAFFAYYSNAMSNRLSTDIYLGEDGLIDTNPDELQEHLKDEEALSGELLDLVVDGYASFEVATVRENSLWSKLLPQRIRPMAHYLTSYFCHGYHGLSLALEHDFTSSYGFGFSDFLRHNIAKFIGGTAVEEALYERTYMSKIAEEDNWSVGLYWSTFFVYPASDISFIGTVLLVFLIGFLFSLSWKDAIIAGNPFALGCFFSFCIMIVYFSANNQMFQTGENCVGFIVMIAVWLITRIISNKRHSV